MKKEKNQCPFCLEPKLSLTSRNLDKVCEKHKEKVKECERINFMMRNLVNN